MDNSLYTAKTLLLERAEILPPDLVSLISGGAIDIAMYNSQEEFHLDDTQTALLENETILTLLLFFPVTDFGKRIAQALQVTDVVAAKMSSFIHEELFTEVAELLALMSKTPDQQKSHEKKEDLSALEKDLTQKNEVPVPQESDAAQADTPVPEDASSATTSVQAMRTMEGDMNRVHGYGAYRAEFPQEKEEAQHKEEVVRSATQTDLLTEKEPLTDMPSYASTQSPTTKEQPS